MPTEEILARGRDMLGWAAFAAAVVGAFWLSRAVAEFMPGDGREAATRTPLSCPACDLDAGRASR